jgi:hypothetical protein
VPSRAAGSTDIGEAQHVSRTIALQQDESDDPVLLM